MTGNPSQCFAKSATIRRQTGTADSNGQKVLSWYYPDLFKASMDVLDGQPTGPTCPICHQVLFGRPIWLGKIGNCHDTCVIQVVQDDIDAQRAEVAAELS